MKIKIKRKHIFKGVPADTECCVIACALKDAGYKGVDVDHGHIRADGIKYTPTKEMTELMKKFDSFEDFTPVVPREIVEDWEKKNQGWFKYSDEYQEYVDTRRAYELEVFADRYTDFEFDLDTLIQWGHVEEE